MATSARAGGLAREVLRVNTGAARAGGLAREVIRANTGVVRLGGVVREILVEDVKDQARVGGVVREALVTTASTSPATRVLLDGLVREALVFGFITPLPAPGGGGGHHINKHQHHLEEESDDPRAFVVGAEEWPFFLRMRWPVAPVPVTGGQRRDTLFIANVGRLMGRGS